MGFIAFRQGFGYAKALIFGEYAVMHGADALVMALSTKLDVQISDAHDVVRNDLSDFADRLKSCVVQKFGSCPDFELSADGFLDSHRKKLGIGGSAAAVVALLDAMSQRPDRQISLQDAIDTHRMLQNGMGSGADVIASAMGGILHVSHCPEAPQIARIAASNLPHIAILATHHQAPTCLYISAAEDHKNTRAYHDVIREMSAIYAQMMFHIKNGEKTAFLEQNSGLIALLEQLGRIIGRAIVPDYFYDLQKMANDCHVTLKTSGAGGGDILLAMAENSEDIDAFVRKLPDGFSRIDAQVAPERDIFA